MNTRLEAYLDKTEKAVRLTAGKDRALAIRLELEAHLYEAIAEGQEQGMDIDDAVHHALENLGQLDHLELTGLRQSTTRDHLRKRFAAWFTGVMLLLWPWAGWLMINEIYAWAVPLSLGLIVSSFVVLSLRGPRMLFRPVLGAGLGVTLVNAIAMSFVFVQALPLGPALQVRHKLEQETVQLTKLLPNQERHVGDFERLYRYYLSDDSTREGALQIVVWPARKGKLVYPVNFRDVDGRNGCALAVTDDFSFAKTQWSICGPTFLSSQNSFLNNVRENIARNRAALVQPFSVTLITTLAANVAFLIGFLVLVTIGCILGKAVTSLCCLLTRLLHQPNALS